MHLGPAAVVVVALLVASTAGCGANVTSRTVRGAGGTRTAGGPTSTVASTSSSSAGESHTSTVATSSSGAATSSSGASSGGPAGPPTVPLRVSPTNGHPGSTISFSFVAPEASPGAGAMRSSWSLSVVGPSRAAPGCVARRALPLPVVGAGKPVTASLGPQQLGGQWCVGSYVARVDELQRPRCAAGQMCPEFIRLVAVAGPARFRIAP